jgi:hypothetical protein
MFENNLIAGVSGQGGGYSINDSLRFNDDDSAYLSRTPATASNRKTFTWSGWVKRGNLSGVRQTIFGTNNEQRIFTYALEFEHTILLYSTMNSSRSQRFLQQVQYFVMFLVGIISSLILIQHKQPLATESRFI